MRSGLPGRRFAGKVAFVYPSVDPHTRTAKVRVEIPNPDGRLKTDMYGEVEIATPAAAEPVLAVPDSAVLDSGARQVVLVDRGEGRFEPRAVRAGRSAATATVEVLERPRATASRSWSAPTS